MAIMAFVDRFDEHVDRFRIDHVDVILEALSAPPGLYQVEDPPCAIRNVPIQHVVLNPAAQADAFTG